MDVIFHENVSRFALPIHRWIHYVLFMIFQSMMTILLLVLLILHHKFPIMTLVMIHLFLVFLHQILLLLLLPSEPWIAMLHYMHSNLNDYYAFQSLPVSNFSVFTLEFQCRVSYLWSYFLITLVPNYQCFVAYISSIGHLIHIMRAITDYYGKMQWMRRLRH